MLLTRIHYLALTHPHLAYKHDNLNSIQNGFYLGTDGFSLGRFIRIDQKQNKILIGEVGGNKKWLSQQQW